MYIVTYIRGSKFLFIYNLQYTGKGLIYQRFLTPIMKNVKYRQSGGPALQTLLLQTLIIQHIRFKCFS